MRLTRREIDTAGKVCHNCGAPAYAVALAVGQHVGERAKGLARCKPCIDSELDHPMRIGKVSKSAKCAECGNPGAVYLHRIWNNSADEWDQLPGQFCAQCKDEFLVDHRPKFKRPKLRLVWSAGKRG